MGRFIGIDGFPNRGDENMAVTSGCLNYIIVVGIIIGCLISVFGFLYNAKLYEFEDDGEYMHDKYVIRKLS